MIARVMRAVPRALVLDGQGKTERLGISDAWKKRSSPTRKSSPVVRQAKYDPTVAAPTQKKANVR